jgi:hypothetical protein
VSGVEYEIEPEPDPAEAAALISAISRVLDEDHTLDPPARYAQRWRLHSQQEAVDHQPRG